ncbi:MAG TPA: di-heme oxidoredictase family protein [Alphaproteobacteria bacterium]|nr:di-heme oxidoredictase family protein [Alphaproteobacteria bacterium]
MATRRLTIAIACAALLTAPLARAETGTAPQDAFLHPLSPQSANPKAPFNLGRALFLRDWAIAPGPEPGFDGLGPLFSRLSCDGCHTRAGRGAPPAGPDFPMVSMILRLSAPGEGPHGGPRPDPVYGYQLDRNAVPGVPPEGFATVTYREIEGHYADGEPYTLRKPEIHYSHMAFGPLASDAMVSARVAPALVGLGLLEAVPAKNIEALAREEAKGGLVHGRPNYVWDVEARAMRLGRFGWKANEPSLVQQIAAAFNLDLGLTNPLYPTDDCTAVETACRAAADAAPRHPKIGRDFVDAVAAYVAELAPPPQRDANDPEVRRGATLFGSAGCIACHRPRLETADDSELGLRKQAIHPYTDLLLHDMGPGLADGRPDYAASGRDWRTAPLWGIGLIPAVNGQRTLLHDGRARTLAEAILWHGGEAAASKEAFRDMTRDERKALIAFLDSL